MSQELSQKQLAQYVSYTGVNPQVQNVQISTNNNTEPKTVAEKSQRQVQQSKEYTINKIKD